MNDGFLYGASWILPQWSKKGVYNSYSHDQILYSPSDLVTFLGCHHASFLDVKALNEDMDKAEASTTGQLLQQKGLEHEAAYLQQLKDEGKSVVDILKSRTKFELDFFEYCMPHYTWFITFTHSTSKSKTS